MYGKNSDDDDDDEDDDDDVFFFFFFFFLSSKIINTEIMLLDSVYIGLRHIQICWRHGLP